MDFCAIRKLMIDSLRDESLFYSMILNALPDVGPVTIRRLLERFGSLKKIFSENFESLSVVGGVTKIAAERIVHWNQYFDLKKEIENLQKISGRFISQYNPDYSTILKSIYDPPLGLYVKGSCSLNKQKTVAIIGTRKASSYGLKIAREFSAELASLGYIIVSGMALGIDSAAHEGALSVQGGKTIAVLGSGLDVIYPRENKNLYYRISENGAVVSEFVLGKIADKQTFPIRNRIIAGMSTCVLVAESGISGGSNITANIANEYGRTVLAVPGRIDQQSSQGCHMLIREGATLVSCIDHVLEELQCHQQLNFDFCKKTIDQIDDPIDRRILDFLQINGPQFLDDIIDALELPSHCLIPKLQLMELRKYIMKNEEGQFESLL